MSQSSRSGRLARTVEGMTMQDNESRKDGLSDEEVDAALSAYEDDFRYLVDQADQLDDLDDLKNQVNDANSFTDQLEGILGEKAKAAAIVSPFRDARLLAALCALDGINADCLNSGKGAVAFLRDLNGQAPENSARVLTQSVRGLIVVLVVNRADKMEAHLWINGQQGKACSPPLLFMQADDCVEDYLIGATNREALVHDGYVFVDTSSMTAEQAQEIIQSAMTDGGPIVSGDDGE